LGRLADRLLVAIGKDHGAPALTKASAVAKANATARPRCHFSIESCSHPTLSKTRPEIAIGVGSLHDLNYEVMPSSGALICNASTFDPVIVPPGRQSRT